MSDPSNARPGNAAPPDDGVDALPAGSRIAEFEIRQVLGAGGFGIVYYAWDEALQRDVAIKEYMPVSMAGRGANERVTLRSRLHEENFSLGLQSFVNEARLLARFDEPALVKVFRFWEANGTAYMAMPLYKGRTLRQLRKEMAAGVRDDAWVRSLVDPLLGALQVMHDAEVYHRDIAPDNILWCDDNRPVLLDFGAARLVLADRTQNVTAILKPQFAPIEQYAETQAMRQGPWTDLYALAGTVYFMLTGRAPLPATARAMDDELEPLERLAPPGCSPQLLKALDWAMAVRPQDRPQSVAQFRDALAGRIAVPVDADILMGEPEPVGNFDKTMQATMRMPSTERLPPRAAPAPAPARTPARSPAIAPTPAPRASAPAARARDDDYSDTPERSVMLPPKSGFPVKSLLVLLVLVGLGAGAWTTRAQWLPRLGLQLAPGAAAPAASAPDALAAASAAAPASAAASMAVAAVEPASAPSAAASQSATFTPVAKAPEPTAEADAEPPVVDEKASRAARQKAAREAKDKHDKAVAARLANLTLPPPVLPPPSETHAAAAPAPAPAPAVAKPAAEAAEPPAAVVAGNAPPAGARALRGPREACAERQPNAIGACVKQLCENDTRYRFYPVCVRLKQKEGATGE